MKLKYLFLISLGMLVIAPAIYAENNNNADQMFLQQIDTIRVKGKIVDDNGVPLPGATVIQKGTGNGTITDSEGNFSITVLRNDTLTITFVGYKSIEVPVKGRKDLGNIMLTLEIKELEQVVVIGYGTQRKVDLTGAVAIVNAEELKKVSHSNISTMLQGKVPGVNITTDGQPGADPIVRIRGIGSFGSTAPLYVIDGVPMGTTIRDFSPNDIESIQILKDASAAAIYGSRAANGVVIITTKQGRKDEPMKIDYRGYIGFDQVQKGVYNVMDASQYRTYVTMAYKNYNMNVPAGYDLSSPKSLYNQDGTPKVNTDWFDEAFKIGVRQNHNLNLSGGGRNNTYNVSLDYYKQEGTMVGAGPNLDRYTARINNTMEEKFIKIKTSIVYSHSDQDNMAYSNANEWVQGRYGLQFPVMASVLILPPTIKAYDESTWVLDDRLPAATGYKYDSYGFGTYYDDVHGDIRVTNVLLENSLVNRNNKVDRMVVTGSFNVDIISMFGLKSNNHKFDYTLNLSQSRTHVKDLTFIPAFIQSTTNYLSKENEYLEKGHRRYTSALIENYITYNGKIGLNHINAIIGQTFERELYHSLSGRGITMNEPYYLQVNNSSEREASSYESEHVLASYIGRINYDFDNKYLISLTVRRDGSSRLSSEDRWDWFPSISAGWRIEREKFFPLPKTLINLLKIRGSYGVLGNENIGDYQYMDVMARNNYTYSFGNNKVTGSAISNFVNTAIRWEKKKTLDFGMDLGMFNNKLEFTFDWYKSISEDLLYSVAVPLNAGFTNTTVTMNAATMENSGLEFSLTYHGNKNALKYDISANLSTLNNKVTKLGVLNDPRTDGICRTEVGREVGSFYGLVAEGIFRSQQEIDNNRNEDGILVTQDGAKVGDVKYKDINKDGKITLEGDRTYLGSGLPKIHYGFNAHFEWKGIDLSIWAFGVAKFKAVDYVDMVLRSSYGVLNKYVDMLNAYNSEVDAAINGLPVNTNTNIPRISYRAEGAITNDLFSNRFIQNASYLKIANIELGFNIPNKWVGKYINGLRIYASGQNLITFTKYKGYNVDFAGGTFTPGYNYCSYPTPRTVMFGLNLSF